MFSARLCHSGSFRKSKVMCCWWFSLENSDIITCFWCFYAWNLELGRWRLQVATLGSFWVLFGCLFGVLWGLLGLFGRHLEAVWGSWGCCWSLAGAFWPVLLSYCRQFANFVVLVVFFLSALVNLWCPMCKLFYLLFIVFYTTFNVCSLSLPATYCFSLFSPPLLSFYPILE